MNAYFTVTIIARKKQINILNITQIAEQLLFNGFVLHLCYLPNYGPETLSKGPPQVNYKEKVLVF